MWIAGVAVLVPLSIDNLRRRFSREDITRDVEERSVPLVDVFGSASRAARDRRIPMSPVVTGRRAAWAGRWSRVSPPDWSANTARGRRSPAEPSLMPGDLIIVGEVGGGRGGSSRSRTGIKAAVESDGLSLRPRRPTDNPAVQHHHHQQLT